MSTCRSSHFHRVSSDSYDVVLCDQSEGHQDFHQGVSKITGRRVPWPNKALSAPPEHKEDAPA